MRSPLATSLTALSLMACASGCALTGPEQEARQPTPVERSPDQLATASADRDATDPPENLEVAIAQSAGALEDAMRSLTDPDLAAQNDPRTPRPASPPQSDGKQPQPIEVATDPDPAPDSQADTPEATPSVGTREAEAIRVLESIVLAEAVRDPAGADPRTQARLAALTAFGATAADSYLEDQSVLLAPEDSTAIRALSDLLRNAGQSQASLPNALLDAAEQVARRMPMRIGDVALCRRVDGYGLYEPLAGTNLLAGRAHRMIVYTEVEGFGHRERRSADEAPGRWAVEVSEELNLYHADGTLAWRMPEQTLVEISRKRRRDFYLVQEITLPRTLTVGRYDLKVIVRDKATGAVDERLVPLRVVADPGLASR